MNMWKYLFAAVVIVLAVVGLAEIIQSLRCLMLSSRTVKGRLVLPMKGEVEDVEYKLRCACSRIREDAGCLFSEVVILDEGLSPHTKAVCELLCEDFDEIRMVVRRQETNGEA